MSEKACRACGGEGVPGRKGCPLCGKKEKGRGRYRVGSKEDRTLDGIVFHSIKEKNRWAELRLKEKAGLVEHLERQVRFMIAVNSVHVCDYVADFVYRELPAGTDVVEDAKGHRTAMYKLKKKMFEAYYGVQIKET